MCRMVAWWHGHPDILHVPFSWYLQNRCPGLRHEKHGFKSCTFCILSLGIILRRVLHLVAASPIAHFPYWGLLWCIRGSNGGSGGEAVALDGRLLEHFPGLNIVQGVVGLHCCIFAEFHQVEHARPSGAPFLPEFQGEAAPPALQIPGQLIQQFG